MAGEVTDEIEMIYVIREGFYDNKKGVTFIEEDIFL